MVPTQRVFYVLLALSERPRHGYAIRQEVAELSDGAYDLEPGGLYRMIARLEEAGLLEPTEPPPDADSDDPRRQYYRLTPEGHAVLADEARRLRALVGKPEFTGVLSS